jgi:YVTN family beta-propeller protein
VPFSYLKVLGHDTYLEIVFKVALTLSQVEEEAIAGPVKRYRIKAIEDVVPTIDSVTGTCEDEEIPNDGCTLSTTVTLNGTGANGQKVEIFDGKVFKGLTDVGTESSRWSFTVPDLEEMQHSFTAKAKYGTEQTSTTHRLTVLPQANVTFVNSPYVIARRGRLKNIELQLTSLADGSPISGIITVELPDGFNYSDGLGGTREFSTDSTGKVSIVGVIGSPISAEYILTAKRGFFSDEAKATVTAQGQLKKIPIGGGTWESVISSDGTRLYVTSWSKNNLSIIDTATHTIIKTIESLPNAHGIVLSADERICYISNRSTNKISVIDLSTEKVLRTISTGLNPVGLILSQDERWLFSCDYGSGTVTRVDTNSYETKTIAIGKTPRYGAASPDGKSVYVCDIGKPQLVIIDIEQASFRLIAFPEVPRSVIFSKTEDLAFVVIDSKIAVVDVKKEEIIRYIGENGGQCIHLNKKNNTLHITNINNDILHIINIITGTTEASYATGRAPRHLASSSDENSLYVCNYESNELLWIEL